MGSKASMPLGGLLKRGWAIASIDYRLSGEARFPAQIQDVQAALQFLRVRGQEFGVNAGRMAIGGDSAGGHLALFAALTLDPPALATIESKSSHDPIVAAISFYGPSNLTIILSQSTPHGLNVRIPALQSLLGCQPEEDPELARQASPVFHVHQNAPPLLLIHGDQDPQVPVNQSLELLGAYQEAGLGDRIHLDIVHGAGHGGPRFYDKDRLQRVDDFLRRALARK